MKRVLFRLVLLLAATFSGAAFAAPTTNGLYVTFQTTQGDFSCILYYQLVPRVVANFVGLTEGTKTWLDYEKGAIVRRPFYDGLTFHRVVKNFVIQGGSPNGRGTDDPGYAFKDQFHDSLRHSKAGILSMANSGTNSNGSQFFITTTNTPFLDNKHSVFGFVIEGITNVRKIEAVPVGAQDQPLTPVVMTNVFITRIGSAAMSWNPGSLAKPLPDPFPAKSKVVRTNGRLLLSTETKINTSYELFLSPSPGQWSYAGPGSGGFLDPIVAEYDAFFFHVVGSPLDL